MKFVLASLLLAACLALGSSSAIYGGYASVPVVRHVPVVRTVPVVRHVPVVDSVAVPVAVPVHRTAYVAGPSVVRVGGIYESPLAYSGWLKQKK